MKNKSSTILEALVCKKPFFLIFLVLVLGLGTITTNAALVAHYEFEGSADDSTGNNIGILVGDAEIINDPERGLVLWLDGDGDYVDCGNGSFINNLSTFSVALWFKTNVIPGALHYPHMICQRDPWDYIWALALHGDFQGKIAGRVGAEGGNALSTVDFVPVIGQWYHVAMTYDDTSDRKIRIYINGAEQSYLHYVAATGTKLSNPSIHVTIGNRIGGGRAWDGLIDDVRIYNHVLTEAEIMAIVPEPATFCLLMAGAGIALRSRRRT
ncbi:MAG: hypothetical protein AMJ43_11130 [Coxiella sp. DG_40]|nr:MAG: hypothetical protein AMJ43_11130 [Coxiella sp. DG_40]